MSHWRQFLTNLASPTRVQLECTSAPPDIVPHDIVLDDTAEAVQLEQAARLTHAARIVHRTLLAESLKPGEHRDVALMDVCLELRSALRPAPVDAEVLREAPAKLPQRHPQVPILPERAS